MKTAAILLAALALAPASAAPSRTAGSPPRIVAVGDLHGDFDAWFDIARDARLIDSSGHWAGGSAVLVQLGDVVDRGADSLKIIRSLQQLETEAATAGGRVVVLLGNHEAMNVVGDYRYTTAGEYAAFVDNRSVARREQAYAALRRQLEAQARKSDPNIQPSAVREQWLARTPLGWVEHRAAWSPKGALGRWAARNPAVVKIGGTLFVHGGISAEYAKAPLQAVNRRVAVAVGKADDRPGSVLNDPLGPLWYRGLIGRDADAEAVRAAGPRPPLLSPEEELDAVLQAYDAKRLVVGHTPSRRGIIIDHDGKLARIDSGNSRFYGGPLTWLEIIGDTLSPHTVKRRVP